MENAFAEAKGVPFIWGNCDLTLHEIGMVDLPHGQIVACDPLVCPEREAFTTSVPPGRYPVLLSVISFNSDQRVAFARIQFSSKQPVRWTMAVTPAQNTSTLKDDEFFGYGVDAGIGCFMSKEAQVLLLKKMDEVEDYYEDIIGLMDETYQHTWSWADFRPGGDGTSNIIVFSSGVGDGFYGSYFGYTANGEVCAVVTDFGLFDPKE